ncbi:hypothetical protein [uncultured Clostridium sp.]|uniref:hypothetical protein n=1 Tax=uncultured Clostridium sp. TaxID=59620 RepID=UPI0025F3ADD4|nr:hypothetical protein [uncultured Clostridium sp.]
MNLVNTYEKYDVGNKLYMNFIDGLIKSDFNLVSEEEIELKLKEAKEFFENLKEESDKIEVSEDEINDLRDLKYLIVDSFFLMIDLENFYKYKEMERFKMRAVNHINKRMRASFIR